MPTYKHRTGVYCIRNKTDGKVYIGSAASSFQRRWNEHLKTLRGGCGINIRLQKAWDVFGESSFAFTILERCAPEFCVMREQYWLDKLKAANTEFGYNINPKAGSTYGAECTEETKAKISDANKNRTPEEKARISAIISAARKAHKITEETRKKLSEAGRRRRDTEETKRKRNASLKGRVRSEESRKRMSDAQKGKKRPFTSEEWRRKLSESQKGKPKSPEARKKMSAAKKGRPMSEERKQKLREAWVVRNQRIRDGEIIVPPRVMKRKRSPETNEKIRRALLSYHEGVRNGTIEGAHPWSGKSLTEEHRASISRALKGKAKTESHKAALSAAKRKALTGG